MTLLQETVEPERQGRVFGFVGIVMAVAMPAGMLVFGPLADVVPVQTILIPTGLRRSRSWASRCTCRRAGARSPRRHATTRRPNAGRRAEPE